MYPRLVQFPPTKVEGICWLRREGYGGLLAASASAADPAKDLDAVPSAQGPASSVCERIRPDHQRSILGPSDVTGRATVASGSNLSHAAYFREALVANLRFNRKSGYNQCMPHQGSQE
jgi:hypothetical protein